MTPLRRAVTAAAYGERRACVSVTSQGIDNDVELCSVAYVTLLLHEPQWPAGRSEPDSMVTET
jgi:hypothetical protein